MLIEKLKRLEDLRVERKKLESEILEDLAPGEVFQVNGVYWRHELTGRLVRAGKEIKFLNEE